MPAAARLRDTGGRKVDSAPDDLREGRADSCAPARTRRLGIAPAVKQPCENYRVPYQDFVLPTAFILMVKVKRPPKSAGRAGPTA